MWDVTYHLAHRVVGQNVQPGHATQVGVATGMGALVLDFGKFLINNLSDLFSLGLGEHGGPLP
jgi:hypothetical protein